MPDTIQVSEIRTGLDEIDVILDGGVSPSLFARLHTQQPVPREMFMTTTPAHSSRFDSQMAERQLLDSARERAERLSVRYFERLIPLWEAGIAKSFRLDTLLGLAPMDDDPHMAEEMPLFSGEGKVHGPES